MYTNNMNLNHAFEPEKKSNMKYVGLITQDNAV